MTSADEKVSESEEPPPPNTLLIIKVKVNIEIKPMTPSVKANTGSCFKATPLALFHLAIQHSQLSFVSEDPIDKGVHSLPSPVNPYSVLCLCLIDFLKRNPCS